MAPDNDSEQTTIENALAGNTDSASQIVAVLDGFTVSFYVASAFYGFIIGTNGTTKARIQNETKTTIKIPRHRNGNIEILGKNVENVRSAREQIESIVSSSRGKLHVNHFNNVRITDEGIRSNYERFMQEIMHAPVEGLTESMFMYPIKLHITINVMTLVNDHEYARAKQLLDECVEKVIVPAKNQFAKIAFNVSGVGIFRDTDPSKVNVLFGRIESESLQQIANGITDYFVAEGLSKRDRNEDSVKMHMTLINTRYDVGSSEKDSSRFATPRRLNRKKKHFDATSILEKYKNYEFGSQEVTEILLSSMSEKDSDGFYKTIASVTF